MDQAVAAPGFDRASGIGGSDTAAILGISPWRTPFDVYLEKTHDPGWNPTAETARMRLGKLLEPVLRTVYEQDHPGFLVRPHWSGRWDATPVWHRNRIAYAHLDGVVHAPLEIEFYGGRTDQIAGAGNSDGIWEGKSAGSDRDWQAGVPEYYEAQVRHYLAVSEEPWCDLTVLFLQDARFAHFRIVADPPVDEGIIESVERFWHDHVMAGVPPAIDGSEAAARYLARINPDRILEPAVEAPPAIDILGKRLAMVRANEAQVLEARAELENRIKEAMGGNARMRGTGWSALWKQSRGATKVAWEQIAKSHRASVVALRDLAAGAGVNPEALQFFTDEALDAIVGLYTTTGDPTHPFRFTVDENGGN